MKKITVFACLLVFLFSFLPATDHENGISVALGAETIQVPVSIKEFIFSRYEFQMNDLNIISTGSLKDINATESQNRLFLQLLINNTKLFNAYAKAGVAQFTEKIDGGFKSKWQDEYRFPDEKGFNYTEHVEQGIASQPYNSFFWTIGSNIFIYRSKQLTLLTNIEYSKSHFKDLSLNLLYNYEQEEFRYIDEFSVKFNRAENEMVKIGVQACTQGDVAPWINVGYLFYKTTYKGAYTSKYITGLNFDSEISDIQEFTTTSKPHTTLSISSGIKVKINSKFSAKAFASFGATQGYGFSWEALL